MNRRILTTRRNLYIRRLERHGVDVGKARRHWRERKCELQKLKKKIEKPKITYPSYFTLPIHTYERGHLNWDHAFESRCHMEGSALMSIGDICPDVDIGPDVAYEIYKGHLVDHIADVSGCVYSMVDYGCGTGDLTTAIARRLGYPTMWGVDLSPYYLAIALYQKPPEVKFIHGNIESTNVPDNSQDLVTVCYVFHEMPVDAIRNTLESASRVLRSGGRIVVIDMKPSEIPPYPSYIDVSEPHLCEYRSIDMLELLGEYFMDCHERHLHKQSYLFTGIVL